MSFLAGLFLGIIVGFLVGVKCANEARKGKGNGNI